MIDDLLTADRIDILDPTFTQGVTMEVKRSFAVRQLVDGSGAYVGQPCRVTMLNEVERMKLERLGRQASHRVRFLTNPGLKHSNRIAYPAGDGTYPPSGTILRIVPPIDMLGTGEFFSCYAIAHSEDNPAQETVG